MPAKVRTRKTAKTGSPAKPKKVSRARAKPPAATRTPKAAAAKAKPKAGESTRKSANATRARKVAKPVKPTKSTQAAKPAKPVKASAPAAAPAKAPGKVKPRRLWEVRNSVIHGRGVFAARKIRKKKTIIEYKGDRTTWKEANKRPLSDPDNPYHTFLFGLDDGRVIDADVGGNEARWINHSCKPNCETEEDERGRVFIKAKRRIEPGEELTYDYQLTYDGKMGKKMRAAYACRCGTKKCRGTMLGKK